MGNLRKLALAAGTAIIGLSAQGAMAQSVTMAVAAPVTSLDPHYHQLSPNNAVADTIFDKLVNTDAKSNNLPGLALSWRAVEPNVWEFKLRPNVRFHNGNEFTAEDVAFTLQRLPNVPNSPSSFAAYSRPIQSIEIVDPLTIRFRTASPHPLMPLDMTNVRILDRETHQNATTEDFNAGRAAIGTGPYRVVSHRSGDRIEFERNDNYWGDRAPFQRVLYRMITNDAARTAALLAVPGASAYFLGGVVVYTAKARIALLQIPPEAMQGLRQAGRRPGAGVLQQRQRAAHRQHQERPGAGYQHQDGQCGGIGDTPSALAPTDSGTSPAARGRACFVSLAPAQKRNWDSRADNPPRPAAHRACGRARGAAGDGQGNYPAAPLSGRARGA